LERKVTKRLTSGRPRILLTLAGALLALSVLPIAQTPTPAPGSQDRVAALKKSIQDGQASLRNCQWIETTVISLKGEEKSRKQQTCYYGADGKMQKTPIGAPPAPVTPSQSGKATISIRDYLLAGDSLVFDVDPAANRLLGVKVNTYLDKPDDTVVRGVQFSTLPDGTNYASQTTLDAKAKNIRVTIQNSGHRPL
jgi:hypothetical protein